LPMPNYRFKLKVHRIRPAFMAHEVELLLATIEAWIKDCKNDQWRYTRILLRNYVQVLLNSGMRVGEVNNLRRRDASSFTDTDGRLNYRFLVRGKTGEREVILRNGAVK
jgi:integrase